MFLPARLLQPVITVVVCFCAALQPISGKHDFELLFENFTCTSLDTAHLVLGHQQCGLNRSVRRRTLNMEFSFNQNLSDFEFHIAITLPRRAADFQLLNLTTDGCRLLANRRQVPLMKLGRNVLDNYSNFPTKCPFRRHKIYYIRGFRFDLDLVPAITMETPVRVNFSYWQRSVAISTAAMSGRVVYKSNKYAKPLSPGKG